MPETKVDISDRSIEARSGEAQGFVVAVLAGVAIAVAGIAAVFVVVVLRRWMSSLRRAIDEVRSGTVSSALSHDRSAIDIQTKKLLGEIEGGRETMRSGQIDWSPAALQELLHKALPGAEVLVISNREPYIHNRANGAVTLQTPASGLVSALEPVIRACGGTWIAHGSGSADREAVGPDDKVAVPPENPSYTLRRIWITDEEQDGYYYGLANEGLWPLCHIAFVRPHFRESDWRQYERINKRFADAVTEEAKAEDPIVLVQDYHFALAPRMIRQRMPKATIITFWHIPWPNAETFSICPWKRTDYRRPSRQHNPWISYPIPSNDFFETVDRFVESRIDREHASVSEANQMR